MSHTLGSRAARWAAASVVLGVAVSATGFGVARSDEKKADEPKPAKKDEPKLGFDPKDVRVGPPPELAALRAAVESAAKKGENVDEIRKQLDALEKALGFKPWVKPKPVEEPPAPPAFPGVRPVQPRVLPQFQMNAQPLPADLEVLQKAQMLMLEAALMQADNPAKAAEMMKEARELMMKGLRPGVGGLMLPPVAGGRIGPAVRGAGSRLGVRVEKVPAALVEQNKLADGRGVLVAEVLPDSPADKAGLKAGDIVTDFAGKPVGDDPTDFVRTVQGMKPGTKVDVTYLRKGKKDEAKGVQLADGLSWDTPNVRPPILEFDP